MSGYLGTEINRNTANTAVRFREIPVCAYRLTISEEKRIYTTRDFLRIYRDMVIIREFETMLLSLKARGSYRGISYALPKSVALDIGREAVSVGEAYCADSSDDMFSSDKNIGDLIAKGLSAIEKLTDDELAQIMRGYHEGAVLSPLAEVTDKRANVKEVALDFLLYGLLSEIFNKITGFCYGSCKSRNVYFTPFGFYPCNMTESDSAGLALGAALYHKNRGADGYVIANMNADAVYDGQVWEALCFAGSGAFRTQKNAGLPALFVLNRERDADETESSVRRCAARVCAGIGTDMLYAETVNGSDPLAVIDAVSRKKEILKRGEGPALLETVFDDLQKNPNGADPLKLYREKLIRGGIIGSAELKALEEHIAERMAKICRLAADDEKSPPTDVSCGELALFENADGAKRAVRKMMPEVKIAQNDCKRWQEIQKKREASAKNEKPYQIGDAVFESVLERMYRDPDFAIFGITANDETLEGLAEAVETNRFLCVPVFRTALVCCALGYALRGGSALISLDSAQTAVSVSDVWVHQISAWRLHSAGDLSIPLVLRVPLENQDDLSSLNSFLSAPALKIVYPATPYDAKGIMESALNEETPVIFLESKSICDIGKYFEKNGVPRTAYALPIGESSLKKEGNDITVLAIGAALYPAARAAEVLSETYGIEAEILSARTLVPFDCGAVLRSVEKTGKLLVVGEGRERGSFMRELAAEIGEKAFDFLDAPVIAVSVGDETEIIRLIHKNIIPLNEM